MYFFRLFGTLTLCILNICTVLAQEFVLEPDPRTYEKTFNLSEPVVASGKLLFGPGFTADSTGIKYNGNIKYLCTNESNTRSLGTVSNPDIGGALVMKDWAKDLVYSFHLSSGGRSFETTCFNDTFYLANDSNVFIIPKGQDSPSKIFTLPKSDTLSSSVKNLIVLAHKVYGIFEVNSFGAEIYQLNGPALGKQTTIDAKMIITQTDPNQRLNKLILLNAREFGSSHGNIVLLDASKDKVITFLESKSLTPLHKTLYDKTHVYTTLYDSKDKIHKFYSIAYSDLSITEIQFQDERIRVKFVKPFKNGIVVKDEKDYLHFIEEGRISNSVLTISTSGYPQNILTGDDYVLFKDKDEAFVSIDGSGTIKSHKGLDRLFISDYYSASCDCCIAFSGGSKGADYRDYYWYNLETGLLDSLGTSQVKHYKNGFYEMASSNNILYYLGLNKDKTSPTFYYGNGEASDFKSNGHLLNTVHPRIQFYGKSHLIRDNGDYYIALYPSTELKKADPIFDLIEYSWNFTDTLYFTTGRRLYSWDGSQYTPKLLKNFKENISSPRPFKNGFFINKSDTLCFWNEETDDLSQLTFDGTRFERVIAQTASKTFVWTFNEDSEEDIIWVSDGTSVGMKKVFVQSRGDKQGFWAGGFRSRHYKGKTLFILNEIPTSGERLLDFYITDGTPEGTKLLTTTIEYPSSLGQIDERVLIKTGNRETGVELYVCNLEMGTMNLLHEFVPGPLGGSPSPNGVNDKGLLNDFYGPSKLGYVFFTAFDFDHGFAIWKTDGTKEGTTSFAEVQKGEASGEPDHLTLHKNYLYFTAWTEEPENISLYRIPFDSIWVGQAHEPELVNDLKISVYPNPAKGIVNISSSAEHNFSGGQVDLISTDGKRVFTGILPDHGQIDVSGLPAGTYLLKLTKDDDSAVSLLQVVATGE